jgi:hypothetical protein
MTLQNPYEGLPTSSTYQPGYVPSYTMEGYRSASGGSYVQWEDQVFSYILRNLNSEDNSINGKPGSWDESKFGAWSHYIANAESDTGIDQTQASNIRQFIRDGGLDQSAINLGWGTRPDVKEDEYIMTPEAANSKLYYDNIAAQNERLITQGEQDYDLKVRAQDFAEKKWELSLAAEERKIQLEAQYKSSQLAMQRESNALRAAQIQAELQIAEGRLEVDRMRMVLEDEYRKASLQLQREEMEQNQAQFDKTFSLQERAFEAEQEHREKERQQKRAEVIARLSSNPADWVAREYFTRQGSEVQGQISDVFTGADLGQGTLNEAMTQNAANSGLVQAAIAGQPVTAGMANTGNNNPSVPANYAGTRLPQYAGGSYGYENDRMFVVGDAPRGRTGNEEVIVNPTGAPFAVLPNHEINDNIQRSSGNTWSMNQNMSRLPQVAGFAEGSPYSDPYYVQGMPATKPIDMVNTNPNVQDSWYNTVGWKVAWRDRERRRRQQAAEDAARSSSYAIPVDHRMPTTTTGAASEPDPTPDETSGNGASGSGAGGGAGAGSGGDGSQAGDTQSTGDGTDEPTSPGDTHGIVTYDAKAIMDTPSMKFLRGEMPFEEWSTFASLPTEVPALGVTIPAPNALNWVKLNQIRAMDQATYQSLVGLWKAGNRDLDSEIAALGMFAPRSSGAFNASLVRTV